MEIWNKAKYYNVLMIFQSKTGLHPSQQKVKVSLFSKVSEHFFFTSRWTPNTKRLEITAIGNQLVRKIFGN